MPLSFAVSSKGSTTLKENYFGYLTGRNGGCEITTLFLLIVCENNHFWFWGAGCAFAKAALAHVCSPSELPGVIPTEDTVSIPVGAQDCEALRTCLALKKYIPFYFFPVFSLSHLKEVTSTNNYNPSVKKIIACYEVM